MNRSWKVALPALALTIALAPNGSGEEPPHLAAAAGAGTAVAGTPHLGTAIAEQRNLVSARPQDAGVWNDLGNLLTLSGSLDEAESAYVRSLELDPGSVPARFNLGLLRQQRGDFAGAAEAYRELLEIEPGHAWAQYQLGVVYASMGDREHAIGRYAEAFTLDPDLLFAEKNPHIIENDLVTEALLRARRGRRAAPPAPRAYDEPARINSILTPPPTTLAAVKPAPVNDDDAVADAPSAAAPPRDQIGRGAAPHGTADSGTAVATTHKDRVLDSGDLRGSVGNQVHGSAESDGAPAAPNSRRRSAASVTPQQSRTRSVTQPPANNGAGGFGVGVNSTGALEWKLGPASDEPVPAR